MSTTGKQSPLGMNVVGSFLEDTGLYISVRTRSYMGSSNCYDNYNPGRVVNETCLKPLTYAINKAYNRNRGLRTDILPGSINDATFEAIAWIGTEVCEALGNSKPPLYIWGEDDTRKGIAAAKTNKDQPATTGYPVEGQHEWGQEARWNPYHLTNVDPGFMQWGWFRLIALQAFYEFHWNEWLPGKAVKTYPPEYKDFCGSFMDAAAFIDSSNKPINTMENSHKFLKYTHSNMDDLISSDITSVSLSTKSFGQDMITSGRIIDLEDIDTFGLPSSLLKNLRKNNAITPALTLALLSAEFDSDQIEDIAGGTVPYVTADQEKRLYAAYLIIKEQDLKDVLIPLNCKTKGLETLADLLNPKKIFPNSYRSLTVPVYNSTVGLPTGSKTFYPIYRDTKVNPLLNNPSVKNSVGILTPGKKAPIIDKPVPTTEKLIENIEKLKNDNIISNTTYEKVIKHVRTIKEKSRKNNG